MAESPGSTSRDAFAEAVCRRKYWRELVPELSIEGVGAVPPIQCDPTRVRQLREDLIREGYFQWDSMFSPELVRSLRLAVERLRGVGCPLVFAFVYDEFWNAIGQLAPLLAPLLGTGFRQLPDFWVWYLDPAHEEAGWKPHRDKGPRSLQSDGSPKSLSVWIPLTDVTPLNGCMYIVPAMWDASARCGGAPNQTSQVNLQDVRALPAPSGSVLGWNQALLHWGGRASRRATEPRISFACEFQRGDVNPFNHPLLDPRTPPGFSRRLGLIGKQLLQYRHMYGLSEGIASLGEDLQSLEVESSPQ